VPDEALGVPTGKLPPLEQLGNLGSGIVKGCSRRRSVHYAIPKQFQPRWARLRLFQLFQKLIERDRCVCVPRRIDIVRGFSYRRRDIVFLLKDDVVQRIEQQRSIYGHRISADLSNLSSSTVMSSMLTPVGFGPLERPSLGSRRQRLAFVQSGSSASSLISDAPAFWQWFWRSFATVGPGARQRSPLAGRPLSLSSLAEWYSDREARDGAKGNSGTRSRPEGPARLAEFCARCSTIATTTRTPIWLCSFPKKGSPHRAPMLTVVKTVVKVATPPWEDHERHRKRRRGDHAAG